MTNQGNNRLRLSHNKLELCHESISQAHRFARFCKRLEIEIERGLSCRGDVTCFGVLSYCCIEKTHLAHTQQCLDKCRSSLYPRRQYSLANILRQKSQEKQFWISVKGTTSTEMKYSLKKSEKQISAEKVRHRVTGRAFISTYLLAHIEEIQQLFNIY